MELSRLAHEQFWLKLVQSQWASLGFSFFFFALSLATSGIAVFIVATYSRRSDVALSYDFFLYQVREEMFLAVKRGLSSGIQTPRKSALPNIAKQFIGAGESNRSGNRTEYQFRLLALCADQIRQSGICSYPPFLELIRKCETSGDTYWTTRPYLMIEYHYWRITSSYRNLTSAAHYLQESNASLDPSQLQILIQIVATESHILELESYRIHAFLGELGSFATHTFSKDLNPMLRTMTFTKDYLLHKEATGELLSKPEIRQRCYRYLSELQEATHEITQILLTQIAEAALSLGIPL